MMRFRDSWLHWALIWLLGAVIVVQSIRLLMRWL